MPLDRPSARLAASLPVRGWPVQRRRAAGAGFPAGAASLCRTDAWAGSLSYLQLKTTTLSQPAPAQSGEKRSLKSGYAVSFSRLMQFSQNTRSVFS